MHNLLQQLFARCQHKPKCLDDDYWIPSNVKVVNPRMLSKQIANSYAQLNHWTDDKQPLPLEVLMNVFSRLRFEVKEDFEDLPHR